MQTQALNFTIRWQMKLKNKEFDWSIKKNKRLVSQ